jgi:nicotinamidase-related amidase
VLAPHALAAARRIKELKERARRAGIPAIYVNDNFGRWRSDFKNLVDHVIADETRGRDIAMMLQPEDDDYFVLKPKHSGFYSTSLNLLLQHLGCDTLILCGWAADICVLFTATDAHMREYELVIPRDCVASEDADENERALDLIGRVHEANITVSIELNLDELLHP